jgi:hypothetical protein
MRIPAKVNADSGGNANGIPSRRRTVVGAWQRWHLDCAGSVRLRQEKLVRNGPERSGRRVPLAEKGVRGKGRQPLSRMVQKRDLLEFNDSCGLNGLFAESPPKLDLA